MQRNILVALDNSPSRQRVLSEAIELARATGARLMLQHVLSAYDDGSPGVPLRSYHAAYPVLDESTWAIYQERWQSYEQAGIQQLQEDQQRAESEGITAEFTQSTGEPTRAICELARSWGADLVMVGNHGRRGLSELLLGSVSNYVMHHAPCSVLVVREQAQPAAAKAEAATTTAAP